MLAFIQFGCSAFQIPQTEQNYQKNVLDSWTANSTRRQIEAFVDAVCDPASSDYVPRQDRKAIFDLDGTLLCEKPDYIEVVITKSRLREKATADPSLANQPLYKAALNSDDEYINKNIKDAILEAFNSENLTYLSEYWRGYVTHRKHPTLNCEYANLFYKPMIDLIVYLQQAGFSVFVASTSQQEFIRSFCPDILPVPKENVVGSMVGFTLVNLDEDAPHAFVRNKEYFEPYNADEGKALRLRERGIGPMMIAAGNSMGDYAMLDGVSDESARNLVIVIDHDDSTREFEYHKPDLLAAAKKRGWLVVSMKRDFKTIFDRCVPTKNEP